MPSFFMRSAVYWMQAEPFGGVARSVDAPAAGAQHLLDVRAFHGGQRGVVSMRRLVDFHAVVEERERVTRGVNQRAFDDISSSRTLPAHCRRLNCSIMPSARGE
jgi:hypothetical protein